MKNTTSHQFYTALIVLVIGFGLYGCSKEEAPVGTNDIEFVSLVVEKDNVEITQLTKITATVKGSNLSYTWKCDNELGVFEGSGNEVYFTICHGGKFKITCEVKDNAKHEASKEVYVTYVE